MRNAYPGPGFVTLALDHPIQGVAQAPTEPAMPAGTPAHSCPNCRRIIYMSTAHDQLTADLIQHRAAHHPPSSPDVIEAHSEVRNRVNELAQYLNDLLPDVPEKRLALEALDLAMMHANSAVARTQLMDTGYYPGT